MRSLTGRRSKLTLPISRKPDGLPMLHQRERSSCLVLLLREDAPIIERHYFDEFFAIPIPVAQYMLRVGAPGELHVPRDEIADELLLSRIFERLEIHHLKIAALGEIAFFVDDIGDTAAHARR